MLSHHSFNTKPQLVQWNPFPYASTIIESNIVYGSTNTIQSISFVKIIIIVVAVAALTKNAKEIISGKFVIERYFVNA